MPAHFASESELRELLAKKQVTLDLDSLGRAGRNQSKEHSELVNSVIEWLRVKGILCVKNHVGSAVYGKYRVKYGATGWPDVLAVRSRDGRFIGLEIKTGAGRQRPEQRAMQEQFERANALYLVIRRIEDLEKWFA